MANELRIRQAFLGGLVDTADLAAGATTFNSAGLAALATTIGSTNHLPIVLDPDGIMGAPEIAYLTAVTAGATSGTILKGQEGTTDRAHLKGTPWVCAPTLKDFVGDSAWTNLTLNSPWTVYTGGGSYPPNVQYRKLGNGLVRVRGMITSGTTIGTIGTLPVGYRPGYTAPFAVSTYNGSAWGVVTAAVDVTAAGLLELNGVTSLGSGYVIGLDGINFLAEG